MFQTTKLSGVLIFEPKVYHDDRGYFFESYNKHTWLEANIKSEFVQDNQSYSKYGTLRGLHYQTGKHAQAKLIRVISGRVLDIAVDIRQNSPTFGQYVSIELSDKNQKQLYIPRGLAHGFIVLSDTALFSYKCDNFYCKDAEAGIHYADPTLNIDWQVARENIQVNQRDQAFPILEQLKNLNTV